MLEGRFILFPGTTYQYYVPNTVVAEGKNILLNMALRADGSVVAGDGNFYMGLCGPNFTVNTTLSTINGEPVGNGYARQPITRNATGWPVSELVNGKARAQSKVVTFTPSGGDFSLPISRFFLCTVGSGTSGKLISVSAALPSPYTIKNGIPFPVAYELFLE